MGVPLVIIHLNAMFHCKPLFLGYPLYGKPHMLLPVKPVSLHRCHRSTLKRKRPLTLPRKHNKLPPRPPTKRA